jgi:hypothetical protein
MLLRKNSWEYDHLMNRLKELLKNIYIRDKETDEIVLFFMIQWRKISFTKRIEITPDYNFEENGYIELK